jgi:DNA-binding winged helix-turn-helix (wHTH) protein/tetratricopeptide (TPR) repeat protein
MPIHRQRPPHTQSDEAIAFRSFQLDRQAGTLIDGGKRIPLRPKTWAVLLYLADRPGVLVTAEELLDAVWPDVAVTPSTLTKSIVELRAALGDDPRQPRCIETVHRRGFRFVAPPTADLRSAARSPDANVRDGTAPAFVGREAELRQLNELLRKAGAGHRQIVFITGPVGIGKTTLVQAFLESPALRSVASPVWTARGVCIEQRGAREAYMPVLDALERLAHRADADRLVGLLRRAAPTWLAQIPWLLGDDADAIQRSLDIAKPERMMREFAALAEALTTDTTLVLVLEDLHWSDPSTVDLLAFLAQRPESARLLIIGTYRPAEVAVREHILSSAVRTLRAHHQCTELPLHDLSEAEVRRYLELRFPVAEFAPALATKIHQYTDGNPLFMVSVVQHKLLRGWIVETNPGWALSVPLEKLQLEIPEDVRQAIEMDFERLSPNDRALLQAASVVGVQFTVQAAAAALACSLDDAESRCAQLARTHWFLRAAGSEPWSDGSTTQRYGFTHPLFRDVAYAGIPEGRRQGWHHRIGEAFEAAYGERASEIAPLLALHFEQSRDYTRAVRYLAMAAAQALRRVAHREAISYLEDALAHVARLADDAARRREELELRLALAPILAQVHGFASEPMRENLERADALSVEVGSLEQRFQIVYSRAHLYWHRADKAVGPDLLVQMDQLASRLGTVAHRLMADASLVRTAFLSGRFTEACRLAEERLPAPPEAAAAHLPFVPGIEPVPMAHCQVAVALWMLGHSLRARELMEASLRVARDMPSRITLSGVLWFAGFLEALLRNPVNTRRLTEEALALTDAHGFEHWHSLALGLKGWVLIETGMIREGIETLKHARDAIRATRGALMCTHLLAFQAEGHRRLGEVDAGLAAVDEALVAAETTLDCSYWPELWRLQGELLLVAGSGMRRDGLAKARPAAVSPRWPEAERCLLRALEMARESQAKSLELRAATSLARAWHARERTPEAHALLSEICQWFRSVDENRDLDEARTLLEQVGVSTEGGPRRRKNAPTQLAGGREIS